MDKILKEVLEKNADLSKIPFVQNALTEKIIDDTGGEGLYSKIEVDLSVAHTDLEIPVSADRLTVESVDDAVTIKLNSRKNPTIDLQMIPQINGAVKRIYVTNASGSGTLKLLAGSKGMVEFKKKTNIFLDNEILYFGTGKDYGIFFDGTNFIIENQGGVVTTIFGGTTAGDDLYLRANAIDTHPEVQIHGNNDIIFKLPAGKSFVFKHTVNGSFTFDYASNVSTVNGGNTTGDTLELKCNTVDDYPFVRLSGDGAVYLMGKQQVDFGINNVLAGRIKLGADSLGGALLLKETTTPVAVGDYGAIYTKADNHLYFQSGAGVEYDLGGA